MKYFSRLPERDYQVSYWYYFEGLSQNQIAALLGVNQSSVNRLLASILYRLQCYVKQESPIQVRQELEEILPDHLVEPAFFFYFQIQQDRVKYFLRTSQPTARNLFKRVLDFLEKAAAEQDHVTKASDKPGSIGAPFRNDDNERKRRLAQKYLGYFHFIKHRGYMMTHVVKSNDAKRKGSLVKGRSILG